MPYYGEEGYLKTIDQLLGYVTYRDIKTAILIFSRNKNFTDVLEKIQKATIQHNFINLMGFNFIDEKHLPKVKKLVKKFIKLSSRCYPVPEDLELKFVESLYCSPFNFSRFFRFYPILRRSEDWNEKTCCRIS